MTQDIDLSPREEAALWCSLLADGPLDDTDREAFESWLEESAENRLLFDQASSIWGALPLPVDDNKSSSRPTEAWKYKSPRTQRRFIAAIVCVLAFAIVGASGMHWLTAPKVYTSQVGQNETIALGDGSEVLLDADSEIRVKLTGAERKIWLDRGRAQFKVSHDAHRPFSVVGDGRAVVALGTQFTVDRVDHTLTVDLVEGRLAGFDSEAGLRTAAAHARLVEDANYNFVGGQRLQWRGTVQRAILTPISVNDATAWTTGRLVFVDAPLRDAIATVNRYTIKPLEVEDGVRSDLRISGIYRAGDVNAFILGVSTTTHLKAKKENGTWILKTPE